MKPPYGSWTICFLGPFLPQAPDTHARGAPAEKDPGHEHDMIYVDLLDLGGDGGPNRGIDGKPLPFWASFGYVSCHWISQYSQ
jgi:hypothetical protein